MSKNWINVQQSLIISALGSSHHTQILQNQFSPSLCRRWKMITEIFFLNYKNIFEILQLPTCLVDKSHICHISHKSLTLRLLNSSSVWMLIILALHHRVWDNWNGPNLTQSCLYLCNAIESNKCNQEVITSLSKVNRWYYELRNIRAIERMSAYQGLRI